MSDFWQDIESMFAGGESSDEERLRKKQEGQVSGGYTLAENRNKEQYFGPLQDDIEKIRSLRDLLDNPGMAGVTLTPDEIRDIRAQIAQLDSNIEQKTGYKASYYTPETDYEVNTYDTVGYTPEKTKAASELQLSHLFPDIGARPEYESAAQQAASLAAQARADEGGLSAQREALSGMRDIYKQGGLTAIDRARLEESRRRNQMLERASREAIQADMERRGISGSGVELASRLANQQGSAERQAQEALGTEAMAQERAERALGAASGMGQQLAEDVYRRGFQTGNAQDVINAFNTQGTRDVQAANRAARDQYAQWQREQMLRDVDRIANADRYNTMTANEAAQWNANNQNAANQWNAAAQNEMNQWGANAQNQGGMFNTSNQNAANQWNAIRNLNQISATNQQLADMGNLQLANQMALAGITAQTPASSPAALANNLWNLNQAIGNEVQKGMSWGTMGKGGMMDSVMPGGSSEGNTNILSTR